MTELNRFRDGIRRFLATFEKPVLWVFRGAFSYWILHLIRTYFGYSASLEDMRLGVAVALICAFVPWSFGGLILLIILLLELYSLSPLVALIALGFVVLGYLLCAFYGARHVHNMVYIPPCYPSQFSFAMPMVSALFGQVNEITSVLCGGVFAFFLATIRKNSTMFIDSQPVSIPDLLMQTMLGNRLLYYYLAALSAMFLVTWVLRTRKIPHAWLIAVLAGVASETAIMAVGYNATGNSGRISGLLTINLLLIAIGIVINFFVRGLDYARIEDLQFEDDDYVYYVTAVPKMHFVEEEKRVKRITGDEKEEEKEPVREPVRRKNPPPTIRRKPEAEPAAPAQAPAAPAKTAETPEKPMETPAKSTETPAVAPAKAPAARTAVPLDKAGELPRLTVPPVIPAEAPETSAAAPAKPANAPAAAKPAETPAAAAKRAPASSAGGAAKPTAARRVPAKEGAAGTRRTAAAPKRTLTPEERAARREAAERRAAQKAAEQEAPRMRPIDEASAERPSKGE